MRFSKSLASKSKLVGAPYSMSIKLWCQKQKGLKGERLRSFYSCVSALLSIQVSNTILTQLFDKFLLLKHSSCSIMWSISQPQLRDLLMRSITSYVSAFQVTLITLTKFKIQNTKFRTTGLCHELKWSLCWLERKLSFLPPVQRFFLFLFFPVQRFFLFFFSCAEVFF